MKITIATDAWGQVNGVVRTLSNLIPELEAMGHEVTIIHPDLFRNFRLPIYRDIKIAYWFGGLDCLIPKDSAIHIMTEGPVGWAVRAYCLKRDRRFTTAYLTNFPEQFKAVIGLPKKVTYTALRTFHRQSRCIMVATTTMQEHLRRCCFMAPSAVIPKGVDTKLFHPCIRKRNDPPLALYVGRVSAEKNIKEFLDIDLNVRKMVVGDGPQLAELRREYPQVEFTGFLHGEALAQKYSDADVLVMPSKTETFGLVMLEALACGTPVAAFPVIGPVDVIHAGDKTGCLDHDLSRAVEVALRASDRNECRSHALKFNWARSARCFVDSLVI